jgi:protein-disulfide isomerase
MAEERKEEKKVEEAKHKTDHKEEKKKAPKSIKFNVWMFTTAVFLIAFLILAYFYFSKPVDQMKVIDPEEAGKKAVDYINENLLQPGTSVSLDDVEEIAGIYKVVVSYQGQKIPVYITKDGNYLFLSNPLKTSEKIIREEESQTTGEFDAPDNEKPDVELYVMSFCPYGVQAENAMKPVVDLLKDKANFKIRFIANVGGNTTESVSSLHGMNEAKEDLRQLCIQKYYDQTTFWNYLMEISSKCFSLYRDEAALDSCWKNASRELGIDINKIENCAYGSEGLDMLKADESLTRKYGITGSPTLLINGQRYNGPRTPEDFKKAVCSGFVAEPVECSRSLSTTGGAVSGGCA